ncbi:MAG: ABC transporter ATP-binding protein [Anaerolineales bacterium]|nr:ABC transporter ATP-binding protein [Anaerolineales bacterium]
MSFLELSHIQKMFGDTVAVSEFSLNTERGEFISLLGPSGCGKTTVLRMVAGFEKPTAGAIIVHGQDVTDVPPNKRKIGMVFQSYALFPNLTAAGNIGFGLKVAGMAKHEIDQRVKEMLDLVRLEGFANRYPYQLSGGQQQRVALARALAIQPELLLLDEPLSALDAKVRAEVRDEIRRIQRQLNITTIFVTHDQEEAMAISDRIVVMSKGVVEQIGTPFEVYNFPQTAFVANFVGTLNTATAEILDPAAGTLRMDGLVLESGKEIKDQAKGTKVLIAIRPERFSFAAEQKKANVLDAKIENITFLGSIVRIRVLVGDTKFHMDTFNNPFLELPQIGDSTQITCSRNAVLVLGAQG